MTMMKSGNPHTLAGRLRDKLLARVIDKIVEIDDRVKVLQDTQERNHQELLKRLSNTGYIRLSEREILAKIFSGAKMYLDPADIAVVPHLILDGDWERNITKAWLTSVRDNDVIIDIGANFGYFGLIAAQQTNRKSKTILFEANPHLIKYLKNTVDVNGMNECMVVENLAVADKRGNLKLQILKDYIGSSSVRGLREINSFSHFREKAQVAESVDVKAASLDEYAKLHKLDRINMIKMDIEGFEDKAYEGMRKVVQTNDDISLFIEFTKDAYQDPQGFYEKLLEDFGNVYLINEDGDVYKPSSTDYAHVIGGAHGWVMPLFSKKRDLVTTQKI